MGRLVGINNHNGLELLRNAHTFTYATSELAPQLQRATDGQCKKIPVNLTSSKIIVAIAQLQGPLPDGKHKTVIKDRETLAWKSLEDIRTRLDKVYAIFDALNQATLRPDIVVFPEYSFPVVRALPDLHRKATEYGFIIIGRADSIWQPNSSEEH